MIVTVLLTMRTGKFKILFGVSLLIFMLLADFGVMAQGENRLIRRGNKAYDRGDFKEAEVEYRKALERKGRAPVGEFNLGSAIYEQENFEESASIFDNLSRRSLPDDQRAKSFHNLGNSFMNLQQYDQAIQAYKNALRLNPDDFDTKYNLLYARQMIQNQEQQSQDQQQDGQEQQDQQDQQDQTNQQEQQDQQEQQTQEQQQDRQDAQQNKQQQGEEQAKQMSKEEIARMLQALQDRERETLEKLKMDQFKNADRVKTEKDW